MSETTGPVLVIGGTGMLRPAVGELLQQGHTVVTVARSPERAAAAVEHPGTFVPVVARWEDPPALVDAVLAATSGQLASGAILWVHTPHRTALMHELARALVTDPVVLHTWGSAVTDPRLVPQEERDMPRRGDVLDVFLGYALEGNQRRWLTNAEVSAGVLEAWTHRLTNHAVGQIDPWDQRP